MHDELTKVDIEKMKAEVEYRRNELRPKLIEEVKVARGFGDLSENFEYKAAKLEKNRNESRIRYLENMINTAVVIEDSSAEDEIGLFDTVTIFIEDEHEELVFRIVTTLRQNPLRGLVSKESPIGSVLMGHKAGDVVHVQVNDNYGYDAKIIKIEKGTDDEDLPISRY
ncbi:MAG: GreA/GreB family elongation factor [Oscillospiraceae bacterium]